MKENGSTTASMAMAPYPNSAAINTQDDGTTTCSTVREHTKITTVSMKVIGDRGRNTVMARSGGLTTLSLKANISAVRKKALEHTSGPTVLSIRATGSKTNRMAPGYSNGWTAGHTLVSSRKGRCTDLASPFPLKGRDTAASSSLIRSTASVNISGTTIENTSAIGMGESKMVSVFIYQTQTRRRSDGGSGS